MSVVYSIYVKHITFNGMNNSFVSIVNISLSPSSTFTCDRSTESFVTRFPGSAIWRFLFRFQINSCVSRTHPH